MESKFYRMNYKIKALEDQLIHKEGYLREQELKFLWGKRKLKTILIFLVVVCIGLICLTSYMDGISEGMDSMAGILFEMALVGPVNEVTIGIVIGTIIFGVRYYLYTHVHGEFKIGPITIKESNNLLADIERTKVEISVIKSDIELEMQNGDGEVF